MCSNGSHEINFAGNVVSVCFSPDGLLLAAATLDGKVYVYDMMTGRCMYTWGMKTEGGERFAFNQQGTQLACAEWGTTLRVYDMGTGKQVHAMHCSNNLRCVACSPDGKYWVSGDVKGGIIVWDAVTGSRVTAMTTGSKLWSLSFSCRNCVLAAGCEDGKVRLYDAKSVSVGCPLLHTFDPHPSGTACTTVRFSPVTEGLLTVGVLDNEVTLWDVSTPQQPQLKHTLTGSKFRLRGASFSSDGTQLATADSDKTVKLWDVASGNMLRSLAGHAQQIRCNSFHPLCNDIVVSGSGDKSLRLWLL